MTLLAAPSLWPGPFGSVEDMRVEYQPKLSSSEEPGCRTTFDAHERWGLARKIWFGRHSNA